MADRRHKAEVEDVFGSITQNSKRIQARKLFNYNIVLIGFMGAGKSTISEFLKTAFAMDVIEMDQIIAEREGMSISRYLRSVWRAVFPRSGDEPADRDAVENQCGYLLWGRYSDERVQCCGDEEKWSCRITDRKTGDDSGSCQRQP